jgi:MFS family permease
MRRGLNLVAAGFALTALSYGVARFAFGLLLPRIRDDLSLGLTAAGWIGGSAFLAYCVGIIVAFNGIGRVGARFIALSAGLSASVGLGLVSVASTQWTLGLGIALAGLSTGLASPPLATAVAARFGDRDSAKANATINAGTAAGIVLSGMAALLDVGSWREVWRIFPVRRWGHRMALVRRATQLRRQRARAAGRCEPQAARCVCAVCQRFSDGAGEHRELDLWRRHPAKRI